MIHFSIIPRFPFVHSASAFRMSKRCVQGAPAVGCGLECACGRSEAADADTDVSPLLRRVVVAPFAQAAAAQTALVDD
eukprot:350735-Chlamydomonas_euryale.AAC.4